MDTLSERPAGPDEASDAPQERRTRPRFPWPPPGLEAERGRLWQVLFQLGLGSLVLVLPLLLAVARRYPFWSFSSPWPDWSYSSGSSEMSGTPRGSRRPALTSCDILPRRRSSAWPREG